MAAVFWPILAGIGVLAGAAVLRRAYRREMSAIETRLATESRVAQTAAGPVEYAIAGEGPPVLVIHGASGGFDQGLLIARRNLVAGVKIIAPSRFGYLRTPLPCDASPAAQADAHAALLDALRIDRVAVLGFSAGGRSALQLALRHPGKIQALILENLVLAAPFRLPNLNASATGRLLIHLAGAVIDPLYWLAIRLAPGLMIRFAGAPSRLYAAAAREERDFLDAVMRGMLPLSRRLEGLANDAVNVTVSWPLETVAVPVLVIAADDDLFQTMPAAREAATRIKMARLVAFAQGSHLLIGHHDEIRDAIAHFLTKLFKTQ